MKKTALLLSSLLTLTPAIAEEAAEPLLSERENVQRFIERMVSKHQFERAPLTEMINQLALREKKKKSGTSDAKRKAKMNNPAESRP